ncbi:MAG: hypothetical protein ACXWZG_06915, partial [Microbacterium sp.]
MPPSASGLSTDESRRRVESSDIPHSGTLTQCRTYRTGDPMADAHIPDKPALEGLEAKWSQRWDAEGTY